MGGYQNEHYRSRRSIGIFFFIQHFVTRDRGTRDKLLLASKHVSYNTHTKKTFVFNNIITMRRPQNDKKWPSQIQMQWT